MLLQPPVCVIFHIFFDCLTISIEREFATDLLYSFNILFNFISILSSEMPPIIVSTISLFRNVGFIV